MPLDSTALAAVTPALEAMSQAIIQIGLSGSARMFELINNFLGGVHAASLTEAIAMIDRSSLDARLAIETRVSGTPDSPMVKMLAAACLRRITASNSSWRYKPRILVTR